MIHVAVIVVNYNSGIYLSRCLDALEAQTCQPKRVIVVDNASNDDSASTVLHRSSWIQLLPLSSNTGFARANNIALSYLQDVDRIALLNPDTVPAQNWLEEMMAGVERHASSDFFGCRMLGYDENASVDGTADVYHVSGLYWRRDHGKDENDICDAEEEIFSPCAAAALYHRKSLMDVGGFDDDYFCYSEDIDLGFRLRARGCRAWYLPQAIVRHVGSATTGKDSEFTVYHGHRNLVWTYFKNMPGRYVWLYLPQHVLLNLISIFYFLLRGRIGVILRAKRDALIGLPRVLVKRKLERHMRIVDASTLIQTMKRGVLTPYLKRHE